MVEGLLRTWIVDSKVYPGIPMPSDSVCVRENSDGYKRAFCKKKILLLLIILARLCWLTSCKVLVWRHGFVSFAHKKHHDKFNKP